MAAKILTALVVMAAAQMALASRQPVPGISTSVSAAKDGIRSSVDVFYENLSDDHAGDANGNSYSALHYPTPPTWGPSGGIPSTEAAAESAGMAKVDLPAGRLHLYNSGWINSGYQSSVYGWVNGSASATLTDVITLDKPAKVTIYGRVHGSNYGVFNDTNNVDQTSAGMGAKFGFWQYVGGEMGWQMAGYNQIFQPNFIDTTNAYYLPGFEPRPVPVNDIVNFTMDLPAGNTYFTASLSADFRLMVSPGGSAITTMAFENTADFQILVPEGVTATSQSGLLPISVPEPSCLAIIGTVCLLATKRRR